MNQAALQVAKAKKILIVEDEGDICLLLNIILNGEQTDIDHVNSIAKAKTYLQKEQPSLIMLDNKLPDGLGIDFIEYIKQHYPAIKILMISGFGTSARDLAISNGADHFIEKPFTKQQVSQSVQALLI
ncbi:response regulator [Ferruginibacter sp. HRS2-29]|uniref:response regulator n=1 Tax=Ferruginibacter sp. HRS2-29 TaxID=2487334 RepID=UPI0020CF2A9A|nr:response regulator [Ferruginibacter sp. HRS2-29]MCP9751155.1 response regulator [Ferruginibacter sp. HRS2-29]